MPYIFLLFLFSQLVIKPVIAVSPTSTVVKVTEVPTKTDEIQKIREVVQEKVREKLKQITQPTNIKKGLIGKIIQADNSQFTIDYSNTNKIIKYTEDTAFVDANKSKSTASKFKVGQEILAMGTTDDSGNLIATRIVGIDLASLTKSVRVVTVGKIVDISKSSPIFSLVPVKNKDTQYQIKTDTKTEIVDSQDQKINLSTLKSGQKIITILTPDVKMAKTYYAKKIINLDYTPTPTPTKKL